MIQGKVSIIVACYNQAEYIKETLLSVSKQSYDNWECIIWDDGSEDNLNSVVKEYIENDSRFKYFWNKNTGVCIARNMAIEHSSGEYLLCLDGDDKISSDFIQKCVAVLDKNIDIKVVATDYQYFGRDCRIKHLEPYSIEKLMGHNLFVNCSMFRRADFDRVGGFNANMKNGLEDWDFWLSILEGGGDVEYLKGVHFFYRIKSKKQSRNHLTRANERLISLRKQIWMNHKDLYSNVYSSPFFSQEYLSIANSPEYKIGRVLLRPLRLLINYFRG